MNSSAKKPPIGIKPRAIHLDDRRQDIFNACIRYREAGKEIPSEWIDEYVDLCGELSRHCARTDIEGYLSNWKRSP